MTEYFLPDAAAHSASPVKPGLERQFIEDLELIFRQMDVHTEALQAALRTEIGKRAKPN